MSRNESPQGISTSPALTTLGAHCHLPLDLIPDPAFIHTVAADSLCDCFVAVNTAASRLLGYSPAELLQLAPTTVFLWDNPDLLPQLVAQVRQGEPLLAELTFQTRDGQRLPVEINTRLVDLGGQSLAVTIARDLTFRHLTTPLPDKFSAQLLETQKLAAISTLARGIAHDFNNILMAIIGFTTLAQDDFPPDSRTHHYLQETLKASRRAQQLVDQILTFSHQQPGHPSPIPLAPVVQEALAILQQDWTQPVTLTTHLAGTGLVLADAAQIQQVVINLCVNAYQALDESGGNLSVILIDLDLTAAALPHPDLAPGPYVSLEIADTGPGIPPEILNRIFEPYFTTRNPATYPGMGLAIVHGIVAQHHGAVTVASTPGQGTVVHVYLPRLAAAALAPGDQPPPLATLGGSNHILFVDDELALVGLIQAALPHLGYHVTTVADSPTALKVFLASPGSFDAVVTDLYMPYLSGLDLARQLIAIRPDLPIIFLTGCTDPELLAQCRALGVRDILTKPISMKTLAASIQRLRQPSAA